MSISVNRRNCLFTCFFWVWVLIHIRTYTYTHTLIIITRRFDVNDGIITVWLLSYNHLTTIYECEWFKFNSTGVGFWLTCNICMFWNLFFFLYFSLYFFFYYKFLFLSKRTQVCTSWMSFIEWLNFHSQNDWFVIELPFTERLNCHSLIDWNVIH